MPAPTRTLVIGLDACDRALARGLAEEGRAPTFARLLADGAVADTHNPDWLFVGAVWPTFATGTSPMRHGLWNWEQIDGGTYHRRDTSPVEMRGDWYWEALSDAGRRVCVIDVPHTWPRRPVEGVVVSEWACHDRHFGLRTHPSELAGDLLARHRPHEVSGLHLHDERQFCPDDELHRAGRIRTGAEDAAIWRDHLVGLDGKLALTRELLGRGGWDHFTVVFGESHNVGHQLWHVHDTAHPRHDPSVRAEIGDPVLGIYERLDRAVGALLDDAGPDTRVAVVWSHGMGPHHDGTHLIEPFLHRLHRAGMVGAQGTTAARAAKRAVASLPGGVRAPVGRAVAATLRHRLRGRDPAVERGHWKSGVFNQPWFLGPNNTVTGGIRLNVVGREPDGVVLPEDVPAVVAHLRRELLALVNVATGECVVESVHLLEEAYPDRPDGDPFPDVLVEWNRTAPIETVWSPTIGVLHEPYTHWRTGDHRNGGMVAVVGPGIVPGHLGEVDSRALAPTFAGWSGVALAGAEADPIPGLGGLVPAPAVAGPRGAGSGQ